MTGQDLVPIEPQQSYQPPWVALGAPVRAGQPIGQTGGGGATIGPVKQATAAPIRKVIAGLIATGITWAAAWAAHQWLYLELPDTVTVPLTGAVFGLVAYIVPPSVGDIPVPVSS